MLKLILALFMSAAHAEQPAQPAMPPHIHGVTVPDWYDRDCCDNRDCHPVDDQKEIEAETYLDQPTFRYTPRDGSPSVLFPKNSTKWRPSQDERFHVCVFQGMPLCIYIPAMG